MKRLLATAGALALTASAAFAQSGPVPGVVPSPWYVGGQIGYVSGTADLKYRPGGDFDFVIDPGFSRAQLWDDLDYDGWQGGVYAGYRWMYNQIWYLGGEIGYNWADASGTNNSPWGWNGDITGGTSWRASLDKTDEFYINLKGGAMVQPNTLVYAIAGYQYANFDFELRDSGLGRAVNTSDGIGGLQVGLGVEWFASQNLSIRGEYKLQAYDSVTKNARVSFRDDDGERVNVNLGRVEYEPVENVFMMGVSWSF